VSNFDSQRITPPPELVDQWIDQCAIYNSDPLADRPLHRNGTEWAMTMKLAARWGAQTTTDALRHQWPEPITSRPPTAKDADSNGFVQYLASVGWLTEHWRKIVEWSEDSDDGKVIGWLHTPRWRPKPPPTLREQGLAILNNALPCGTNEGSPFCFSSKQMEVIRQALTEQGGEVEG
jgi:hypothetical protein